jgi:hypothetical protein
MLCQKSELTRAGLIPAVDLAALAARPTLPRFLCAEGSNADVREKDYSLDCKDDKNRPFAARRKLLDQPLSLHCFLDLGTRSHAVDISFKVRPFAEVDVYAARPAKHREKICVRDGERVACQILLAGKRLVEPVKSFSKVLF